MLATVEVMVVLEVGRNNAPVVTLSKVKDPVAVVLPTGAGGGAAVRVSPCLVPGEDDGLACTVLAVGAA